MKFFKKLGVTVLLTMTLALPAVSFNLETKEVSAAGTGYTKASDVQYVTAKVSNRTIIANWGARDEECVFLSEYAEDFYTGSTLYETMSTLKGGTSQTNVKGTALYNALQTTMATPHTFFTYYEGNKNVRDYYKYTDCVQSDTSKVALLYKGGLVSSTWDSGNTWNQEHMWPKSKLSSDKEIGDIMQLRPANPSENSSRGNTAYGESSGYYDPNKRGQNVRGDAARLALYMYVRWGSSSMWGSGGVIESMNVLLKWMEEDPVDTWEMGRNDAVQSVTGTRNVFVDYPEYAWLLFGKDIPDNMTTPSGIAEGGTITPPASSDKEDSSSEVVKPDSSVESTQPDSSVEDSSVESTQPDSSVEDSSTESTKPDSSTVDTDEESSSTCNHVYGDWIITKEPTETENGACRRQCKLCRELDKREIVLGQAENCPHAGNWIVVKEATETEDGERRRVCDWCRTLEIEVIPMGTTTIGGVAGCNASVGATMGSVLLILGACAVVEKNRRK